MSQRDSIVGGKEGETFFAICTTQTCFAAGANARAYLAVCLRASQAESFDSTTRREVENSRIASGWHGPANHGLRCNRAPRPSRRSSLRTLRSYREPSANTLGLTRGWNPGALMNRLSRADSPANPINPHPGGPTARVSVSKQLPQRLNRRKIKTFHFSLLSLVNFRPSIPALFRKSSAES